MNVVFVCVDCDREFYVKAHLLRHNLVHKACNYCGRTPIIQSLLNLFYACHIMMCAHIPTISVKWAISLHEAVNKRCS